MDAKEAYTKMRKALEAAGHPIVFSMCEWGTNKPWLWAEGWSRALERPRYAGSGKWRYEYHRIQSPFQSVVYSGSASYGGKRLAEHVR